MKIYAAKPAKTMKNKFSREEFIRRAKEKENERRGIKTEESEMTNVELETLVKALIVLAYYTWSPNSIPTSKLENVIKYGNAALPVVEKSGISSSGYLAVLNEVTRDGEISENEDELITFLKATLGLQKKLLNNYKISPKLFQFLDYARKMAAGSESSKTWIEKNVGELRDPFLTSIFTKTIGKNTQDSSDLERLAKLVKALGGKGYNLTGPERKSASVNKPAIYKEFLGERRAMIQKAQEWGMSYVRTHGEGQEHLVNYDEFWKALKSAGLKVHNYLEGFKGYIDDKGRLYTIKKLRINGAPGGGKALMNEDYDAENDIGYVFRADIPGAVTQPWYYTENHKERSTQQKFEKVSGLADKIDSIRAKWLNILRNGDIEEDEYDRDFLSAMMLEIIYQTQARIGDINNATKDSKTGEYKQTYGLSTIQMRHVRVIGAGIRISYEGKAARKGEIVHKQIHNLVSNEHPAIKKIVKILTKWKQERGPKEYVFQTSRGGNLSAFYVNKLFKRLGANTTVHKLRTLKGTVMMNEIVEKHPWKKKKATNSNEVMKWLKEKAEAIGAQLGHAAGGNVTGNTAIQNYCDPGTMTKLFKEANVMIHPSILKLVNKDASMKGIE